MRCSAFRRDEAGAGSAFGLFGIIFCLMFAGLSIDATNAWRNGEILRLSADVAAHAGASRLAEEQSREVALAVAAGAAELNTPVAVYGRTIHDRAEDIQALSYDPQTNMVSPSDKPNAVSVRLERNDRVDNPVPTFILRLIGRAGWNLSVTSVAAVVPTERCRPGDGIYGHQKVAMTGEAIVGSNVCLHSQVAVDLAGQSSFKADSGISMPDMSNCQGGCNDLSSPGFAKAAASTNLIMTDPVTHIDRLAEGFANPRLELPEKTTFFTAHPLAEDMSGLEELGVDTSSLSTGDVVPIKAEDFPRVRELPAGLVYAVTCPADSKGVLDIGGRALEQTEGTMTEDEGMEEDDEWADVSPPDESLSEEPVSVEGQKLNGIALVTNCALNFTDLADIRGSLIISTRTAEGITLSADAGASAGDPTLSCNPSMQSTIMAKGAMRVPADFTLSNVSFVIGGEVDVAGDPSGNAVMHRGLAIHAGGPVQMSGAHAFEACETAMEPLLPVLNVIKYVIPTDPLVVTN
ncbi:MAG: hypothetical protein DI533_21055 [Cereibacter sphaeroides]|uniref:DUF7867 domain-containing protein n=1 Tax=Cereibacter sphaeroides TaxID=1063 RepID=A0A2W5TVU4_CERSP|nr:MAG: hypothetical protein DI533_21055 [Cereibacter sphaeroides]